MVMFLVFLGVAGAIAAVGVVDDMVADIEDDVLAEAEKWLPRGSDEAGAGDLLAEAVGADGADLEVAQDGNDGAEARAAAWAEDAELEEDRTPVSEGVQGEGEDVTVEAVVLEGSWAAAKTEPVADENTQEQVEEVNEVVPVERVTQVARTSEQEASEEQLMVADTRIYEVIDTVSGLSLEDVMGQGAMETAAT